MAYDIHLGVTKNDASRHHAVLQIEENIHDLIFSNLDCKSWKYPLFCRMKDYYKDAVFSQGDLGVFQNELTKVKELFKSDQVILLLLEKIILACHEADSKNLNVYGLCD